MIGFIILGIAILITVCWLWAGGIEYMHKHHSKYKGEDFLNWDKDINNKAGRDSWDESLYD